MTLVAFAGTGEVYGLNSLCNGPSHETTREAAMTRVLEQGATLRQRGSSMSFPIARRVYAQMYGPTVGDRVRLADTELFMRSSAILRSMVMK